MKSFDVLAKALGALILLLVVVLAPLLLVGQRALNAMQDANLLSAAVERYWLNDGMLVSMGRDYADKQLQETPHNDRSLIFWRAVATFDDEQWRTLMGFLAPGDALAEMVGDAAVGFVTWLRMPNAEPDIRLSLVQWKQGVLANLDALTNWFLAQFRPCNVGETAQWGEALLLDDWSLPPLCMPLGAPRRVLVEGAATGLREAVAQTPDSVTVLDAEQAAALAPIKSVMLRAEERSITGWGALAVLWLLGLVLFSRSWGGLLRAVGGSALGIGLGVAATTFAWGHLSAQAMRQVSDVPVWAVSSLQQTADFYLQHILMPLRLPGVATAIAGALMWLAGMVVEARRKKAMGDTF